MSEDIVKAKQEKRDIKSAVYGKQPWFYGYWTASERYLRMGGSRHAFRKKRDRQTDKGNNEYVKGQSHSTGVDSPACHIGCFTIIREYEHGGRLC